MKYVWNKETEVKYYPLWIPFEHGDNGMVEELWVICKNAFCLAYREDHELDLMFTELTDSEIYEKRDLKVSCEFQELLAATAELNRGDPLVFALTHYIQIDFPEKGISKELDEEEINQRRVDYAAFCDHIISQISNGRYRYFFEDITEPFGGSSLLTIDQSFQVTRFQKNGNYIFHGICTKNIDGGMTFLSFSDLLDLLCEESPLVENPDGYTSMKYLGMHCDYFTNGKHYTGSKKRRYGRRENVRLCLYKGAGIPVVKIPPFYAGTEITQIDSDAFSESDVEEICVPETVSKMGFESADSLKRVNIPHNMTVLPVFKHCSSLEEFVIPEHIEKIPKRAFYGCSALRRVVIGSHVLEIEDNAFDGCVSLEKIEFEGDAITFGKSVFKGCISLGQVVIRKNFVFNGSGVFKDCTGLKKVIIEEGFRIISEGLFKRCTKLSSIEIPQSVEQMKKDAFLECNSLAELGIPNHLQSIDIASIPGSCILHSVVKNEVVFSACNGEENRNNVKYLFEHEDFPEETEAGQAEQIEVLEEAEAERSEDIKGMEAEQITETLIREIKDTEKLLESMGENLENVTPGKAEKDDFDKLVEDVFSLSETIEKAIEGIGKTDELEKESNKQEGKENHLLQDLEAISLELDTLKAELEEFPEGQIEEKTQSEEASDQEGFEENTESLIKELEMASDFERNYTDICSGIGDGAFEQEFEQLISEIGAGAIEEESEEVIAEIGASAIEEEPEEATAEMVDEIVEIGAGAIEEEPEEVIAEIGASAMEEEPEEVIGEIGASAMEEEPEEVVGEIGASAMEEEPEEVTAEIVDEIVEIGAGAIEEESEEVIAEIGASAIEEEEFEQLTLVFEDGKDNLPNSEIELSDTPEFEEPIVEIGNGAIEEDTDKELENKKKNILVISSTTDTNGNSYVSLLMPAALGSVVGVETTEEAIPMLITDDSMVYINGRNLVKRNLITGIHTVKELDEIAISVFDQSIRQMANENAQFIEVGEWAVELFGKIFGWMNMESGQSLSIAKLIYQFL